MSYWAVMPNWKNREEALSVCRIEKAYNGVEALHLCFAPGSWPDTHPLAHLDIGKWLVKNLGTLSIIRSDKKRVAALRDVTGWVDPFAYRVSIRSPQDAETILS